MTWNFSHAQIYCTYRRHTNVLDSKKIGNHRIIYEKISVRVIPVVAEIKLMKHSSVTGGLTSVAAKCNRGWSTIINWVCAGLWQ